MVKSRAAPRTRGFRQASNRLVENQVTLSRVLSTCRGSTADEVYARLLAREHAVDNMLAIQRLRRRANRLAAGDFRRGGPVTRMATGANIADISVMRRFPTESVMMPPQELSRRIQSHETVPFSTLDRALIALAKISPSRRIDLRHPIKTWGGRSPEVTSDPAEFADLLYKRVRDVMKTSGTGRAVIALGGLRGAGKTKSIDALKATLAANGIQAESIGMDSYFKEPEDCKARAGWDNPRNSDLGTLSAAIRDFRNGVKITVPTDRVPRHGNRVIKEIDPTKTKVLLVEGIHALEPKISRHADVRGFFYITPGLQEIRTTIRDVGGDTPVGAEKAKQRGPHYYGDLNTRVRPWQEEFLLPRVKDAEFIFEQKYRKKDVDAIARLAKSTPAEQSILSEALATAWKSFMV